jgi:hypothetical protein
MKKTPAYLVSAIGQYGIACRWVAEKIRVKHTVPVENQASHIRDGFPALWVARLEGQQVMLEAMLHHAKCYAGFYYTDPNAFEPGQSPEQIGMDNPAFAEWSRQYIIRR